MMADGDTGQDRSEERRLHRRADDGRGPSLAERIGGCTALEQQRLAWALVKLTGREFANLSQTAHPAANADSDAVRILTRILFGNLR
mgnify:CR=1 FL=1